MAALSPEDYSEARRIFHAALDLDGERRSAFLDENCAGKPDLRVEVEELLKANAKFDNPRTESIDEALAASAEAIGKLPSAPFQHVGPYRILGVLGEGGMGSVYLAEQEQPIRRRVALKLTKHGGDKEILARFEAERQALALMNHPNIAQVYDAGATDDGRPYFVMEVVEGVPITEHCDRHNLDISERLQLFAQVCRGLEHAHNQDIIHRDLKPSNVLVTLADGKAAAKIIDFGVARATNQRLTEKTLYTEIGRVIGTPAYMSPEQADLTGYGLDHRADIYSLGVILYELLVGELPLEIDLRAIAFDEVVRRIREEEPPTPSVRLSRLNAERLSLLSEKRQTTTSSLHSELRGDLDWICMQALAKEPERRYKTVGGFAQDLQRYLDNEAVLARPPSGLYRLRKLVRKNRGLVAATALILASLSVGLLASLWFAFESRDLALKERAASENAETNADLANLRAEELGRLRDESVNELYRSLLNETRAVRLLNEPGWRRRSLNTLQRAADLDASARDEIDLRREAIACTEGFDAEEAVRIKSRERFVWSMDFSPDGTLLAVARETGLRIWDVRTWKALFEFRHRGRLSPWYPAVRFDPAGSKFVYSHPNGGVRIVPLRYDTPPLRSPSIANPVQFLDFDASGELLAVSSSDKTVGVHHLPTGDTRLHVTTGHRSDNAVAISPDGRSLATRGSEDTLLLHDLSNGGQSRKLGSRPYHVRMLSFSPDGKFLAGCSRDQNAFVWEVATGEERSVLRGHRARLQGIEFASAGSLVATCSNDQTARIWDARTGSLNVLMRAAWYNSVSFSLALHPHQSYLATACQHVSLFRLTQPKYRKELRGESFTGDFISFHPVARVLATGCGDKQLRFWDLEHHRLIREVPFPAQKGVRALQYSPDGDRLAAAGVEFSNRPSGDYSIYVFDSKTGDQEGRLNAHRSDVESLAFDPSGQHLASSAFDTVYLWDLNTAKPTRRWQWPLKAVRMLRFLGDGTRLIVATGGDLMLVDVDLDKEVKTAGVPGGLAHAAVNSTERHVVVAGATGTISVLSLPSLESAIEFKDAHDGKVNRVAFGTVPHLVASGGADGRVFLWDIESQRKLLELPAPGGEIGDLAFEPRRGRLAVCPKEEVISLWDINGIREHLRAMALDWPKGNDRAASPRLKRTPTPSQVTPAVEVLTLDTSKVQARVTGSLVDVLERRRRIARSERREADAVDVLATRLHVGGHYGQAMSVYAKALTTAPISLADRYQLVSAAEDLVAALDDDPDSKSVRSELNKAVAALETGGDALALRSGAPTDLRFRQALALGGVLRRGGREVEAKELLEHALKLSNFSAAAILELSNCERSLGNSSAAAAILKEALERNVATEAVWASWFATNVVDLRKSASDVIRALPKDNAETQAKSSQRAELLWAMTQLTDSGAIRINCGGKKYTAKDGSMWGKDCFFAGGLSSTGGRKPVNLAGTEDDLLHQMRRWFPPGSNCLYTVPLPRGRYSVTLYCSEIYYTEPGKRRFDVSMEGQELLTNIEPPCLQVMAKRAEVLVDDGFLDIEFIHRLENPTCSAIEIRKVE